MNNEKIYNGKVFEYITNIEIYGYKNKETNEIEEILIPNNIENLNDLKISEFDERLKSLIAGIKAIYFEENTKIKCIPEEIFKAKATFANEYSYDNLETVVLAEGIEIIETLAFAHTKLENVILPKSLKKLHASAFYGTKALEKHLDEDGIIAYLGDSINPYKWAVSCINYNVKKIVEFHTRTVHIADACFFLRDSAPSYYGMIEKVIIHKNIESIGQDAFYNVERLIEVEFEEDSKIDNIPEGAFWNCESLRKINIPNTVKIIHDSAFHGTKLETVHLNNVEEIHYNAFVNCDYKEIYLGSKIKYIDSHAFNKYEDGKEQGKIYIESNSKYEIEDGIIYDKETSTAMIVTSSYIGPICVREGTKIIGESLFYGYEHHNNGDIPIIDTYTDRPTGEYHIIDIVIPEGVEKIEANAFSGAGINGIKLPKTLKEIETGAFQGNNIKRITMYNNKCKVHPDAFSFSNSLEVKFLDNTPFDGRHLIFNDTLFFVKNNKDIFYELPKNIVNIGGNALKKSTFNTIVLHENVKNIYRNLIGNSSPPKCLYYNCVMVNSTQISLFDNSYNEFYKNKNMLVVGKYVRYLPRVNCSSYSKTATDTIQFEGTKNQWELIKKENLDGVKRILCSDGVIELS